MRRATCRLGRAARGRVLTCTAADAWQLYTAATVDHARRLVLINADLASNSTRIGQLWATTRTDKVIIDSALSVFLA